MPLIVLVGSPCTSKTYNANKIKNYLETEKNKKVIIINEESLGIIDKSECYKNNVFEKNHRAKLKSEVEKNLDDNIVVILDSLNYIKGYRYELFCLVRNFKTRLCVIYCKTELEISLKMNDINKNYSEELLKDLSLRMEEPIAKNRWDNPLIQIYYEEEPPFEDIYNSLFSGKKPRDPVSTKAEIIFDSNFLHTLDLACGEIMDAILTQQSQGQNNIEIKNEFYTDIIYLKKIFSAIELKKLKQEYIKISKMHAPKNKKEMYKNFIEYINTIQDRF